MCSNPNASCVDRCATAGVHAYHGGYPRLSRYTYAFIQSLKIQTFQPCRTSALFLACFHKDAPAGVIISTVLIRTYGWTWTDAFMSIIIAVLIFVRFALDFVLSWLMCVRRLWSFNPSPAFFRSSRKPALSCCSAPRLSCP